MKIIYGPKGSGKTKAIIDLANEKIDKSKGHLVFITDTKRYSYDLKYQIRVLDTNEFNILGIEKLDGFIKGIVAANTDNEYIFLDGIARISNKPIAELSVLFETMESLEQKFGANFIVTVSCDKEDLPEFVLKYVE